MLSSRRTLSAALTATAMLALTACGSSDASDKSSGGASSGKPSLEVVASFYPLQYAAERVGGSHVTVSSLTKPGAEPHDLELTPKQAGQIAQSSLLIYLAGFQPSVDAAAKEAPQRLDVASVADLSLHADEVTAVDGESADDHDHDHGSEHGADPHFWLDPTRYAKVVTAIGEKFAGQDPTHASQYRSSAASFVKELTALDGSFSTTLATCTNRNLVTSHTAFGYLAQRYKLHQVGVTAISPDQEPTPGRLKAVTAYVKANKVTTIYTETLASPKVAETVAKSTGAKVAVLDPLEGISDKSAGTDYLSVMRSNLNTLKQGQSCQ